MILEWVRTLIRVQLHSQRKLRSAVLATAYKDSRQAKIWLFLPGEPNMKCLPTSPPPPQLSSEAKKSVNYNHHCSTTKKNEQCHPNHGWDSISFKCIRKKLTLLSSRAISSSVSEEDSLGSSPLNEDLGGGTGGVSRRVGVPFVELTGLLFTTPVRRVKHWKARHELNHLGGLKKEKSECE